MIKEIVNEYNLINKKKLRIVNKINRYSYNRINEYFR